MIPTHQPLPPILFEEEKDTAGVLEEIIDAENVNPDDIPNIVSNIQTTEIPPENQLEKVELQIEKCLLMI